MDFGNDKDNIMHVSLSNRFEDLDDYIALHYVEITEGAAEAFGASAPEPKKERHFGFRLKAARGQKNDSLSAESFKVTGNAMPMASFMQAEAMCDAEVKPHKSLDDVVKNLDKSFMELVFSYADERGMNDVELQKKACINRKAFSKLKCGTTKRPSKPTALCLALALELNLDETKDLLSRAGLALSPCSKQDIIVQYFIEKEAYDIETINEALFVHGEECIGDVEE